MHPSEPRVSAAGSAWVCAPAVYMKWPSARQPRPSNDTEPAARAPPPANAPYGLGGSGAFGRQAKETTVTHPSRKQSESGFYHVFTRGSGRQVIYENASDNERFLSCLASSLEESDAKLHAYCLMSNHYHLVLETEYAALSTFAYLLNSAYAKYFNRAHNHAGHLFQERFHSEPIESDEYFLAAIRYVHRNPVEARITHTCDYPWSSYAAYIEAGSSGPAASAPPVPLHTAKALSMLGTAEGFRDFHSHPGKQSFCDDAPMRTQLSAAEVVAVAREALGGGEPVNVKSPPKPTPDRDLRLLRSENLSIRQIALVTGIIRATVQRICA